MGRIKQLRDKVKSGKASDAELAELKELEQEAAEESEGTDTDAEGTETEEIEDEEEDADDEDDAEGKKLLNLGKQVAEIAMKEFRNQMSKDFKKNAAGAGKSDKGEEKPKGKELVKQFFVALLDNDKTKLDHLSTTAGDGGYLIPQEYADQFVEDRRNATVMRAAGATVVQVVGSTFNVPQLATRPKTYWSGELAAKSSTSASWTNITLTPYTLAAIMTASNQVIRQAKIGGNLIDVLSRLLTQAIAEQEDTAFFVGDGSGKPTGLNTYTVTQIDANFVVNFTVLNNMKYRLGQGYRPRAHWFMNSRVLQAVTGLLDSQNRPIFSEAYNSDFPTLLGRPVHEVDDLPSSQIWFGDPSCYWIGDGEGVTTRVSDETTVGGQSAFERNFTAIRVEEFTDGELADVRGFVEMINTGIS